MASADSGDGSVGSGDGGLAVGIVEADDVGTGETSPPISSHASEGNAHRRTPRKETSGCFAV